MAGRHPNAIRSYLTNAVKHFKFVQRGKRRIRKNLRRARVRHYRWWLDKKNWRSSGLDRPSVALAATTMPYSP